MKFLEQGAPSAVKQSIQLSTLERVVEKLKAHKKHYEVQLNVAGCDEDFNSATAADIALSEFLSELEGEVAAREDHLGGLLGGIFNEQTH